LATTQDYLAIDLGASGGRALLGRFDGSAIHLKEAHRFENRAVPAGGGLYWDFYGLYSEVRNGIRLASIQGDLVSIGLDTWGVDFGLLDANDELLSTPHSHRDTRTQGTMEAVLDIVPRDRVFDQTGVQFLEINTLFQLYSMVRDGSPQLDIARTFLTIPDLLNFFLTGSKVCEFSNATTTQCYNPREGRWATELLDDLSIPSSIFPEIVSPGSRLGPLTPSVADGTGAGRVEVIAPACHDTGSAVAAVPFASSDNALYISCGTWALMGAEIAEPMLSTDALAHNFTNEGGVCGTFRFLKNITGLWIVQECKRAWDQTGASHDYAELTELARVTEPLRSIIDPDHPDFATPGDMPSRIRSFCERSGQPVPESEGAVIRCAIESLALKSRHVHGELSTVLGRTFDTIHIVGGGIQNTLLCQLTADATGCEVIAGPVEATAMGNILLQAMTAGKIENLDEAREVVRNSIDLVTYTPSSQAPWDEAYGRFMTLLDR